MKRKGGWKMGKKWRTRKVRRSNRKEGKECGGEREKADEKKVVRRIMRRNVYSRVYYGAAINKYESTGIWEGSDGMI